MLYLTDNPQTTTEFLPRGSGWREIAVDSLQEKDRALWSVFGGGTMLWTCEVSVPAGAPYADRRMVLIDMADASQFDAAMAALKSGVDLPDGLVCLALEGARHRGQRNRPWTALRGNVHFTAHYRVDAPGEQVETGLTMLPAVAAARAIREAIGGRARPGIKWVNDILLDGRKVSGVLTATHVQGATVERAVFGIGVNVARAPEIEPTPFVPSAGSLADYGVSAATVFSALIGEMDAGLAILRTVGSKPLYENYRDMADFIGREITIWPEHCEDWRTSEPLFSGQIRSLREDLSLEIEGLDEPVRKGRLAYG